MIRYLSDLSLSDLAGKKVLLRVDFNVPVKDGKLDETFRIKAIKATLDELMAKGAKVLLISHLTALPSFHSLAENIGSLLGQTLTLVPLAEKGALDKLFRLCPVLLLDNIRQDPREEQNDPSLAAELAKEFDFFVNDAFAVSHRAHASLVALAHALPAYGGLLMKKEIENLNQALTAPAAGKILVLGGAKISTKLPVIKNFLDKADNILVGGAIANDLFQSNGINVGASVVDDTVNLDINSQSLILPSDVIVSTDKTGGGPVRTMPLGDVAAEEMILDIGPESVEHFNQIIKNSSLVIWNGPVGLAETKQFSGGTQRLAEVIAACPRSIVGGGDTVAVIDRLGLLDKYSFVSTGGGAMLDFLAEKRLPGLEALGFYD